MGLSVVSNDDPVEALALQDSVVGLNAARPFLLAPLFLTFFLLLQLPVTMDGMQQLNHKDDATAWIQQQKKVC